LERRVRREARTTWRLARLQPRILHWLAVDHPRTTGMLVSDHEDLVKALRADTSTSRRSLRTLEGRGWIMMGRSPGGKAHHVTLTSAGAQSASERTKKLCIRADFFTHRWCKEVLSPSMPVPGQGAEALSTREDPCGTDRVKAAEVPTHVKEVVARFAV
jgi:DNA-binding MarR family transcriptional regulator